MGGAILAIAFWFGLFLIPIGGMRSRKISLAELFQNRGGLLFTFGFLSVCSAALAGLMSGAVGFWGTLIGSTLSVGLAFDDLDCLSPPRRERAHPT